MRYRLHIIVMKWPKILFIINVAFFR